MGCMTFCASSKAGAIGSVTISRGGLSQKRYVSNCVRPWSANSFSFVSQRNKGEGLNAYLHGAASGRGLSKQSQRRSRVTYKPVWTSKLPASNHLGKVC